MSELEPGGEKKYTPPIASPSEETMEYRNSMRNKPSRRIKLWGYAWTAIFILVILLVYSATRYYVESRSKGDDSSVNVTFAGELPVCDDEYLPIVVANRATATVPPVPTWDGTPWPTNTPVPPTATVPPPPRDTNGSELPCRPGDPCDMGTPTPTALPTGYPTDAQSDPTPTATSVLVGKCVTATPSVP